MARYSDLGTLQTDTKRQAEIRKRVSQVIYNALVTEFGNDFTVITDKKITVYNSDIAPNTVLADVGDVIDKDGFPVGAVVECGVKVKAWNTIQDKNGRNRYAVTLDDIKIAMDGEDE